VEHALREGRTREPLGLLGATDQGDWGRYDIIACADGKSRRVEPGTFPLVDGLPRGVVPSCDISGAYAQATAEERVMRLRGYGNAIVPQLAAEFIQAAVEAIHDTR
jgi:DNA (cytosine-5)-methyltransferase 1